MIKNLGLNFSNKENLKGKNADYNSEKIIEIFSGKDNDFSTAVCLNAAAGLIVSEKFTDFKRAYNHSKEFILSGKALDHLKNIQNV